MSTYTYRNKKSTYNIKITSKCPSQDRNCILQGQAHVKARISLQVTCVCSLCGHHHDLRKTLTAISQENEIIAVSMKGRNMYTKIPTLSSQIHENFSGIRCIYNILPSQSDLFRNHENSCAKKKKNAHTIETQLFVTMYVHSKWDGENTRTFATLL